MPPARAMPTRWVTLDVTKISPRRPARHCISPACSASARRWCCEQMDWRYRGLPSKRWFEGLGLCRAARLQHTAGSRARRCLATWCRAPRRVPWYAGPTLLSARDAREPARSAPRRARFPRAARLAPSVRSPRGYMGASIRPPAAGTEVLLLPGGRRTRVRQILSHGTGARSVAGGFVTLVSPTHRSRARRPDCRPGRIRRAKAARSGRPGLARRRAAAASWRYPGAAVFRRRRPASSRRVCG